MHVRRIEEAVRKAKAMGEAKAKAVRDEAARLIFKANKEKEVAE